MWPSSPSGARRHVIADAPSVAVIKALVSPVLVDARSFNARIDLLTQLATGRKAQLVDQTLAFAEGIRLASSVH
jgi:hypothetical protein